MSTMNVEIMRLRQGRIASTMTIILIIATFLVATLEAFARDTINALISLNRVIPNATQAQSMSPEDLAKLSLDQPGLQLTAAANAGGVGGVSPAALAMMIMGGLFITREYHFASMTSAAVALSRRGQLYRNKCAAAALASFVAAFGLTAVRLLVLFTALAVQRINLALDPFALVMSELRGLVTLVLCGVLGAGLGFLLRRQTVLLLLLGGLFVVESTFRSLATLTGADILHGCLPLSATGLSTQPGAQGWLAAGIVVAWSAIVVTWGAFCFNRRELTFSAL